MLSYSSLHNVYSVQYNFRRIVRAQAYLKLKYIGVNIFLDTQENVVDVFMKTKTKVYRVEAV